MTAGGNGIFFDGRTTARHEHEAEMTARAAASDAELLRVHAILRAMRADEAHGAVQVGDDLFHLEAGL